MDKYNKYLICALVSVLVVTLLGVLWGWSILSTQRSVNESALINNRQSLTAIEEFSELNRLLGFGGLIHNFKNYVLRQEPRYEEALVRDFAAIRAQETVLRPLLETSDERASLDAMMATVEEYRANFSVAQDMVERGLGSNAIDDRVRISDRMAIQSQKLLGSLLDRRLSAAESVHRQNLESMASLLGAGSFLLLGIIMLGVIFFGSFRRLKVVLDRLNDAKREVELLLETTPDSVLAVDEHGTILRGNNTAIDYFGHGDSLVGKKVEELMPESARSAHVRFRTNFVRSPEARDMAPNRRVQALLANGEIREIAVRLGFFQRRSGPTSVISIRDATEENRFKAALIDTQARMDFAASVAEFGIWEWDVEADRLIWDKWTHRLHGSDAGNFGARFEDWLRLVHSEDRDQFSAGIRQAVETAKAIEFEYQVVLPDSSNHYLQLSAGVQCDDNGRVLRVTGISRDITVRLKALREIDAARSQALAANEVKSQFLANMSHEIRTPMNAVLGMLTMLESSELADRQHQLVRAAHSSANSLLDILNDILDFSKLEAGKVSIVNGRFDLDTTLEKSIDLFSAMAASKGISLYLKIKPDVYCSLVGDSLRLNQILGNLLSNAIKFTRKGSVTLEVSLLETTNTRCRLKFSVEDTGIGMSPGQVKRALAPFGQADSSTTRDFGGTGLGLPICASLLSLMGSELAINSTPEKGTDISFDLQLGLERRSLPRYSELTVHNRHVLLVFRDTRLLEFIEETIRPWVGEKIYCEEFSAALALIGDPERDIDFLLTDYSNNLNGNELETLCRHWVHSRARFCDNVGLLYAGYSDPLSALDIQSFKPHIIASPPTPSRLYETLTAGKRKRPLQTSPGAAVDEAIRKTLAYRGARILIVEDVLTNQIIARDFLNILGMKVDVVSDGAEAIKRASAETYDAILMDFHMPLMDGLETTRRMREMPALKHVPIIAMTAAVFEQDKVRARAAGMNAHLSKPVDINELADVLIQNLATSGGADEPAIDRLMVTSQPVAELLNEDLFPEAVDTNVVMTNFNANLRLYYKCLRAFVEDFSSWAHEIDAAEKQADFAQSRALLHKLKGTAANVGANRLAGLVSDVRLSTEKQSFEGLDSIKEQLSALLEDIRRKVPEREDVSAHRASETEIGLDASLESLGHFMESLNNQRYIPADVLDTRLSEIPSFVAPELVSGLQASVEMLDYIQAKHCLNRILESVRREMADK